MHRSIWIRFLAQLGTNLLPSSAKTTVLPLVNRVEFFTSRVDIGQNQENGDRRMFADKIYRPLSDLGRDCNISNKSTIFFSWSALTGWERQNYFLNQWRAGFVAQTCHQLCWCSGLSAFKSGGCGVSGSWPLLKEMKIIFYFQSPVWLKEKGGRK